MALFAEADPTLSLPTFTPNTIYFNRSGVCVHDPTNNASNEIVTIHTGAIARIIHGHLSKRKEFLGITLTSLLVIPFFHSIVNV